MVISKIYFSSEQNGQARLNGTVSNHLAYFRHGGRNKRLLR